LESEEISSLESYMDGFKNEEYKTFIRFIIKINKKLNLKILQAIQEKIIRLSNIN
jgi:hypothetical protein